MSKTKRARIIYNPTSGREAIMMDLAKIMQVYEKAGFETSAFQTTADQDSAKNEAERVAKAGFDLVVAAGGDGTISEVINGISGLKKRPVMAILPAGTTNDYARALNVPRDNLVEAAEIINKGKKVKMDIGRANKKYFMNIAALGTMTEITYTVPRIMKKMVGYLAYVVQGGEAILNIKNTKVKIKHDKGIIEDEVSLVFLALTNSIGGFEKIVPDGKLDDGYFTLLIIKKANLGELMAVIGKALNGNHIGDPLVEYIKTRNVEIQTIDDSDMKVNLDGDFGGMVPVKFENLKQHVEFIADISPNQISQPLPDNDDKITVAEKKFVKNAKKF